MERSYFIYLLAKEVERFRGWVTIPTDETLCHGRMLMEWLKLDDTLQRYSVE